MLKRKRFRQKGKTRLSKVFKKFKKDDKVVMLAVPGAARIPAQFVGKVGTIMGKSGKAYIVRFLNGKVVKNLVLKPEYLKKIKIIK